MLEAITTWPQQDPVIERVALICHPHPLHQGSMYNKVVTTLAKAYDIFGVPTLRFNYRGVGSSAGSYGNVAGELEDTQAVISWLQLAYPQARLSLAGFSFGSYIAARTASVVEAEHVISIAPPVSNMPFADLPEMLSPWLILQGDQDEVVSLSQVQAWHRARSIDMDRRFVIMPGASHFFHGQLVSLRQQILSFCAASLLK